ncbi:HTH-type transcriptional repressor KstR2 [Sebaldella termitidis]|jgi:AcrR family transcriptional regulator|uniref:Transcriptional regulator, TetR family n=1 Tax=Sebaldella termitidis (strain ATCC 33386 / NCTC 11300) TaxID=526218 RepID=D1APV5_SEBTE|nr:TetR/AcrR family transcriptional regulator [Sebaldella termitidis]ACZ10139.1 transcriptional regulator, TetR family [Sebaldella termitidis ATCC 33386]SUI25477.1 HTH-type transcriptional repressor KstR2 [Sebaldella termitidis]
MKEDKKKKILEKAIELFGEAGYLKTTVEEITNSLSISKGSFYTYFDSKESLLLGILNYLFEQHCIILDKTAEETKDLDAESTLRLYLKTSIEKTMVNKNVTALIQQVIFNDFFKVDEIKRKLPSFKEVDVKFVRENIFEKLGENQRYFNKTLVIEYTISSIHTFIMINLKEREAEFIEQNKEGIIEDLTTLILHGIQKEEI